MLQQSWCIIRPWQFPVSFYPINCKGLKAVSKLCLNTVKPCQGGRESIFQSLDHYGFYKLFRRMWAEMVKISTILQWKYWVIFEPSWLEREISGKIPSTFCGQWNKKALMNSLGMAVIFYIAIKISFF